MTVLGNYYGLKAFALLSGIAIAINTTLSALAPFIAGFLFDHGYGYAGTCYFLAGWCFVGARGVVRAAPAGAQGRRHEGSHGGPVVVEAGCSARSPVPTSRNTCTGSSSAAASSPVTTALWQWSVDDLEGFWASIVEFCGVKFSRPASRVLGKREMPGAEWFPGATLNYAEHALRHERPGAEALHASVRARSARRRCRGPNSRGRCGCSRPACAHSASRPAIASSPIYRTRPRPSIAMLATASIGAVWSSCGPDFGARGVLDRYSQLAPQADLLRRRLQLRRQAVRQTRGDPRHHRGPADAGAGDPPAVSRSGRSHAAHGALAVLGRCARRSRSGRETISIRAGAVRAPAVDPVLVGHHRIAQGHRSLPRRHHARTAQAVPLPHGPACAAAHVLLHQHRLDDVELPRELAVDGCRAGALRRQSRLARRPTCCGRWPTTPAPTCSAPALPIRRSSRRPASFRRTASSSPSSKPSCSAGSPVTAECHGVVLRQRESGSVGAFRQRRHGHLFRPRRRRREPADLRG